MNAIVLYFLPLSFKLRKAPLSLAVVLLALASVYRSYPSLGDISFYWALLPIFRRCWKFMTHDLVVACLFVMTLVMMPAMWYLWIYVGSANANFYFGTTLAFSWGQLLLVINLLMAHAKREFCLRNGQRICINGQDVNLKLE